MKERKLRLKLFLILLGIGLFWLGAWLLWSWLMGLGHDVLVAWIILETALGLPVVALIAYHWGKAIAEGFIEGQKAKIPLPLAPKTDPFQPVDLVSGTETGSSVRVEKQEQRGGFTEL